MLMEPRGIWTAPDGLEIPFYNFQDLDLNDQYLMHAARWERKNAYAPYSNFLVGIAALTAAGNVRTGHNNENVVFDVLHGEGCMLGKLEWQDLANIVRLTVVAAPDASVVELKPAEAPVTCCGKCRQMIWEFSDKNFGLPIMMSDPLFSKVWITSIGKLLPAAFGPEVLGISPKEYMRKRAENPDV